MKPRIILLIFMTILLAACNMPTAASTTPTVDAVATQVSQLLTKIPTATTAPAILPSATRAPDATATDTTPTLTQTLTSTPPADTPTTAPTQANDPPDWMDTLEGGKAFYKYENDNTRVTQEGGHLALTGINANGWLGWSLTFSRKPANFRLETVFTTQACSGTDFYGIIFRAPNANAGYFFGVTCDGHYNLHARDFENDTDTVLVNTTSGTGIIPGSNQTNRLAVRAEGEKISLFANGTLLQEVNDASFSSGSFGAFIAANETTGFTVWMEEVSLWNIP